MKDNIINILITNDDGYEALGIKKLATLAQEFGNVVVVAPKEAQSGKSCALSLGQKLHFEIIHKEEGLTICTLDGTPADCIKMGLHCFFQNKLPDLVLSGINHGSNASSAALYSGTLGATKEGAVYGIRSIGISIDTHDPNADFSASINYSRKIIKKYLQVPNAKGTYLNINFPNIKEEEIKGIKWGHQGDGQWIKEYQEGMYDNGEKYFLMVGEFRDNDPSNKKADHNIVEDGYVAIVPCQIDNTDYSELDKLKDLI